MRIKAIVLSFGLLFSGCSATLNSKDIVLDLKPAKKINIGLSKDAIDASKATFLSRYSNYGGDLHDILLSESNGVVNDFTNQPLLLSLAFNFKPEFDNSIVIGVSSLFLPFLAFVPESNSERYYIDYAIRDSYGTIVHQRSLQGTVEGEMTGWYIGRINAKDKLIALEANYAAKNAARLVLKDISENSEELFAAAHAAPGTRRVALEVKTLPAPGTVNVNEPDTEDLRAYQEAKSLNTFDAYTEFLRAHPASSNRHDALAAMSLLIKRQNGSYESYRKFVVEFDDGLEFVPLPHRLALTGPEGTRVHDILRLLKQGIEDKVIAAKIRMQNASYKDFNYEEIGTLKTMGMTSVLIEAMLDSTTRAKREQEDLQKKKDMENLLAEIQQSQKKLDTIKVAQQQPQVTAPGQQASGPSVGDTVKNCAAQIAALEGCKHLPWPANSLCAATAKSQFPCQ